MEEINTLSELMRAISQATFGGYIVDVTITQEYSDGGFLIVIVTAPSMQDQEVVEGYVGKEMFGEFWFDTDDRVMQVL